MSGEPTIADALTDIATSLSGILEDINTQLASKDVSHADTLDDVADQISAIETGTGGITPTGTKSITTNGTHDVTTYASASVNVPTGTARSASSVTVSGNTVTVPAGLYSSKVTKSVATATHNDPTISVNTTTGQITASHTQSTGYVTGGTTTKEQSLTTKSAQTYTPTTYDQTISAGQYLTGTQTIKGDADLVASNIKSGVTIFNVTGNYTGGSGTPSLEWKWQSQINVSRTSTKVLAISGLSVSSGETLVGLVLMSLENATTQNYYADALVLLPVSGGWRALITGYFLNGTTYYADSDFSLTKYGETACQLNSTGNTNFVESYRVSPIVAKVTA